MYENQDLQTPAGVLQRLTEIFVDSIEYLVNGNHSVKV